MAFDDGAPVNVRTYTADAPSRVETVTPRVPAGARRVRVRFRRTDGNNGYGTVDGAPVSAA